MGIEDFFTSDPAPVVNDVPVVQKDNKRNIEINAGGVVFYADEELTIEAARPYSIVWGDGENIGTVPSCSGLCVKIISGKIKKGERFTIVK